MPEEEDLVGNGRREERERKVKVNKKYNKEHKERNLKDLRCSLITCQLQ